VFVIQQEANIHMIFDKQYQHMYFSNSHGAQNSISHKINGGIFHSNRFNQNCTLFNLQMVATCELSRRAGKKMTLACGRKKVSSNAAFEP